jgi:hypothetical protein
MRSTSASAPGPQTEWSDRSFIAIWMFARLPGFLSSRRWPGFIGTAEGRLLPDFQEHKMVAWIIIAAGFGVWILATTISQVFVYIPQQFGRMMLWWHGS